MTTAVLVLTLPLTSVTVRVTILLPTLEHVNEFGLTVIVAMLQLSVLPLLTCIAVTDAWPAALSCTIAGCVTTVGRTLSWTVTTAVLELTFPLTSVTVRVTVLGPTFEHVNALGLTVIEAMPQLSELPLLTCAAVTDAWPAALSCTVTGCVITVGRMLSSTVTVAVVEKAPVFPEASVTTKPTVFGPTFEQSKVLGQTSMR